MGLVMVLAGCGPGVSTTGGDTSGANDAGSGNEAGQASEVSTSGGTSGSTAVITTHDEGGGPTADSTTFATSAATTGVDPTATSGGPKLDLPVDTTGSGDSPLWGDCSTDAECAAGLSCGAVAFGKDLVLNMCTQSCDGGPSVCPDPPPGYPFSCVPDAFGNQSWCVFACAGSGGSDCPAPMECFDNGQPPPYCIPP